MSRKHSELNDKLVTIADGNIELVQDAIAYSARIKKVVRCGFLWLQKKTAVTNVADLKDVVHYIVKHRPPLKQRTRS